MLKGIPGIISPDMMKTLMEMGHTDEIVLADANFPAATYSKRLIRSDALLPQLLEEILKFFPLDKVEHPAILMAIPEKIPTIWEEYRKIIRKFEPNFGEFEHLDRYPFFERSKNAFAVIISGDVSFRANLILKKGVIRD